MKIHKLLQSKIVNIIALLALIYFLFDNTKNNPRSITNQLSGDNLKKNIDNFTKKVPELAKIRQEKADQKPIDEDPAATN